MVQKADGSWRCLNLLTEADCYPLPNMADITSSLAGASVFSKLDLKKGYHQIPVHPAHIKKTAIITPFGLFEFVRLPFGLKNAGMTFQRFMDKVLSGLPFILVYLDDILVASPDRRTHADHLRCVLQRLQEHGLVLNRAKCEFFCSEVEFLGLKVTAGGVAPIPEQLSAVKDFPSPGTVKELQAFLGAVNFYRPFIPAAAKILLPLTAVLKGGKKGSEKLEWTPEMSGAFTGINLWTGSNHAWPQRWIQRLLPAVAVLHTTQHNLVLWPPFWGGPCGEQQILQPGPGEIQQYYYIDSPVSSRLFI